MKLRLGVALLLVVGASRIYLVAVTADQPIWWDEAEYLVRAKHIALGSPESV